MVEFVQDVPWIHPFCDKSPTLELKTSDFSEKQTLLGHNLLSCLLPVKELETNMPHFVPKLYVLI